ncbi:hypothetical protein SAMN04488003_10576 [Loktanella fryxellensis]|uniref:NADH-quinone oxidoreductase subunit E n=1 Tax=Loktanella fryxellensis TaxID=245187 RepID=A0A1H8BM08_9RHOB|nr:hypothetical protein [Loktanella fryxellensis]SEM83184.1 hypothetical protein SAMN04488003_10576 [Loktanella fryxellensis]
MIGLREQGIVVLAAVFGWIGGGVAYVLYDFTVVPALAVVVGVALVVAVALLIGWRDPKVRPMGYGVGPVQPVPPSSGGRNTPHTGLPQGSIRSGGSVTDHAPASSAPRAAATGADLSGVRLTDGDTFDAAATRAGVDDPTLPLVRDAVSALDAAVMPTPVQPYDVPHADATPAPHRDAGEVAAMRTSEAYGSATGDEIADDASVLSAAPAAAGDHHSAAAPAAARRGLVKPSATLAGQTELASRKGSWTYSAAAPQQLRDPDAVHPDDDDATHQPTTTDAERPAAMTAARNGAPDDLKLIRGVGPKLEGLLHSLGIFHFDQIAGWQAREVAWMDENLKGFKGRVSREDWIGQSRILAAGGSTPHSIDIERGRVN